MTLAKKMPIYGWFSHESQPWFKHGRYLISLVSTPDEEVESTFPGQNWVCNSNPCVFNGTALQDTLMRSSEGSEQLFKEPTVTCYEIEQLVMVISQLELQGCCWIVKMKRRTVEV